jgi:hypothetical protein
LKKIKESSTAKQDNVLLEYLFVKISLPPPPLLLSPLFVFPFDFCFLRYEYAILQSKVAGTHVLPVFVGEEEIQEWTRSIFSHFNFATAGANFPAGQHARGDDSNRIIKHLR